MNDKSKKNKCKYERENYEFNKSLKICTSCRCNKAISGKIHCPECADKNKERCKKRYKRVKRNNSTFRQNENERIRQIYKRNKERGICVSCGKHPAEKNYVRCYLCLIKKKRYQIKSGIPRGSRPLYGMCYICGDITYSNYKLCYKHYMRTVKMASESCGKNKEALQSRGMA